jgi:hypothetical protein
MATWQAVSQHVKAIDQGKNGDIRKAAILATGLRVAGGGIGLR